VPGIPQPILIISLVSAALTMASCVFNTLLPIYMVTELKMNMRSMGAFEGLMEGFSYIVRMFSGMAAVECAASLLCQAGPELLPSLAAISSTLIIFRGWLGSSRIS
jgi:hypothetical protein